MMEWGITDPEFFWSLPKWKQSFLIATVEAKFEMAAYEDQQMSGNSSSLDPKLVRRE